MLTCPGSKPPISIWPAKLRDGARTSWKTDWVVQDPTTAFRAIQVGASSQTAGLPITSR